jgi:hypothetical protein
MAPIMIHIRQTAALVALASFGFLLFVGLFALGLFGTIPILFYRGIALAICAAVATGLAALVLTRHSNGSLLVVPAAALTLSFNLCFLVILPVTIDRSISVYLLSTIERHDKDGIDASSLETMFLTGYVSGMGAINRRITEQSQSGNITVDQAGRIRLTAQGKRFMRLSRLVATTFATDPRFVGSRAPEARK